MTGSIEHRLQSHAKAVHDRLWGRPKIVNIAARGKSLSPANSDKPDRQVITPLDFIKVKCVELGSSYADVCGDNRSVKMVEIRRRVLNAAHARYPSLSFPMLGKLINRHGTTVQNALGLLVRKSGTSQKRNERDRKAHALYRQGVTISKIAEVLGISETTVKAIKDRCKWEARQKPKPSIVATRAREARELFDKGLTFRQIAESIGVTKGAISYISKTHNWPKRGTNDGE